ncbi:GIY-YIG nuclease family protein [Aquimarina sp. RZ0]|uniref:GIY-YIG nuclease family protein n=1 Tax=Aquimarina sp. RZ0 TaxID=2607730 RepID=UPI0011F3910F|nr:GIY-YIG nuclease family protein [Aquimarina sp. RZ0]KAA1245832.1 GIY-YIG nuclease family protein [Aquimarina sp. RZ0]
MADAQRLFPNVNFSELHVPDIVDRSNPEFANYTIVSPDQAVFWQEISKYDAEEHGGNPTTWDNWADSLQTGLDIAGLVPGLGEIADLANGCISLARGNYGDAALSFAAMVPGFGAAATIAKQAKKLGKVVDNKGVYDLIVKNADDLEQAYVGQSKNIFKRLKQHFGKNGKLKSAQEVIGGVTHKMAGSTKFEREIYEQFIILEKYRKNAIKDSSLWKKLLNKVNPVGGRFNLNTPQGRDKFYKMAEEIADKYDLPKTFTKVFD